MVDKIRMSAQWALPVILGSCLLALFVLIQPASAQITPLPTPDPQPGGFGVQATKTQPPPTTGATISTPGNGASYTTSPITVAGICPNELIVQIYNNGVMVGSVMCENGSFSLEVSLFAGVNELSALVLDSLDQQGPASNIATVNYNDSRLTAFAQNLTLTSAFGRRSANTGNDLVWPLQLSGGSGPYAFSIDWGDGSETELKSQSLAGLVNISYKYKRAGIYQTSIKVTDANGVSAFFQVISVANGKVEEVAEQIEETGMRTVVLWIPAAIALGLIGPAFWLGRRSQLLSIRNKMLRERDQYSQD